MRGSVVFDTLEYMDELKKSGMHQEHAEAITKATAKAFTQMVDAKELSNKKDIHDLKIDLMRFMTETMWRTIGMLATFQTIILGLFGLIQFLHR
jgi:DNA-binding protein